ncbi:MAG: response regulator [Thermodesulfobacteriota bacterium]|nr:response regulator [Thermodesulfobacteriota bacterium]
MNEHILIVEDEEDILELVRFNLEQKGYHVSVAASGELGLDAARRTMLPELIILDLMLPGIHGLEVCRLLKDDQKTRYIPIIMLTAKGEDSDIVTGLNFGADDYITKPFSPWIMAARVQAVLRRSLKEAKNEDDLIVRNEIIIHSGRHEVLVQDKKIHLTLTEFRILHFLANRPGWVFTRDQIVVAIHSDDYYVTSRSIDVQIMGLRKKLGTAGKYIETVRGVGYKFRD